MVEPWPALIIAAHRTTTRLYSDVILSGAKNLYGAVAIAFQIMFLSRGTALRLPHGATARVRPYKSQNVFLKNYSKRSK
jgi:hypothetical protein